MAKKTLAFLKSEPVASPALIDPWARLAAGVLMYAGLEAKAGDASAIEWLQSDTCALFCDFLGIDSESVARKAREFEPAGRPVRFTPDEYGEQSIMRS